MMQNMWKNKIVQAMLAFLTVYASLYCIGTQSENLLSYTNSLLSVILFGGYWYALSKLTEAECWETEISSYLRCGFGFMLGLSAAMVAGAQLDAYGRVDFAFVGGYLAILVLALGGAPFCAWAIWKLQKQTPSPVAEPVKRTYFYKIMAVLMLAYIPVLLAAWPGFFCYDAEVETYMVFTDKYSAHHPVAHVALLGWIMKIMYKIIPDYNFGIAVYLLLQMLVVSACLAYMIVFLRKSGVRRWIVNTGLVFLMFFPTVSMFVCCTTKDVYFSAGVILFTTLLLEMARDEEAFWGERKKSILLFLSIMLVLLFRNNGIYALAVLLPFYFLIYRKWWKKSLVVLAAAFILFFVFNAVMNAVFHVKPGEKAEMLCVPMQQLARAHNEAKECFAPEDLEILYTLIPESILGNYNPKLADDVKVNFLEDNFKADPGKYISLWVRIGLKRPDIYVNSFLMNTYGYWYPDTILDGYRGRKIVTRYYEDSSYFMFETERPGSRKSLIPALEDFYEKISLEIYQQKVPVVSMLFSPGFWLWAYIFCALYLWKTKYKKQVFALALMGLILLTFLLGPIAIVRYVLYFFFGVPMLLALLLDDCAFVKR